MMEKILVLLWLNLWWIILVIGILWVTITSYLEGQRHAKAMLGIMYCMTREQRCQELKRRIEEEGFGYTTLEEEK